MRKWFSPLCVGLGAAAVAFLMEPWFPLGDWRWGLIAGASFTAAAVPHLWAAIRKRFARSRRTKDHVRQRLERIDVRQDLAKRRAQIQQMEADAHRVEHHRDHVDTDDGGR